MNLQIFNYEKYKIKIQFGFGTLKFNPKKLQEFQSFNVNQTLYVWFCYYDCWYRTSITSLLEFKTILDKTYCQEQFIEVLIKFI